jgi:hypothetical protein
MMAGEYAVVPQYKCNIEKLNTDCGNEVHAKESDFRKHRTTGEAWSMALINASTGHVL